MSVVIFDTKNDKIIKEIRNIISIGIHQNFTSVSYKDEHGEYEVETIRHNPNIYILTIQKGEE